MTVLLAALRLLGNTGALHNAEAAVQADRRNQLVVDALLRRLPPAALPTPVSEPASAPLAA